MTVIQFSEFPASRRTPGNYFEINGREAGGLPPNRQKVLYIGQRTSGGTKDEGELAQMQGALDAITYFGAGSVLERMVAAGFNVSRYVDIWAIALDDAGAGTAATKAVTFAGAAATADATLRMHIANQHVDVAITTGDAAADVAAAVAAACAAAKKPTLQATAAAALAVVTFTAKNKGTLGNEIELETEYSASCGITDSLTGAEALAGGATDPDLDDIDDKFTAGDFNDIVHSINVAADQQKARGYIGGMADPINQKSVIGILGYTGVYADGVTLVGNINHERMTCAWLKNTRSLSCEVAAALAAGIAMDEDPAMPQNGRVLKGIHAPRIEDRAGGTVIENSLWNGLTPLEVNDQGEVAVVRCVTTKTTTDSNADWTFLETNTMRTLDYFRKSAKYRCDEKFKPAKIKAVTPKNVEAELIDVAMSLEGLEILRFVEKYKNDFQVQLNATDPNRLDGKAPAPIVPGLHVLATRIDLILFP